MGMEPEELSLGDRDNLRGDLPLLDLTLIRLDSPRNMHIAPWVAAIGSLLDEEWRVCFTDGSHKGIPGDEKADARAAFESILGCIEGHPRVATEGGVPAASKARRKD
ncbi:hypothetical protein EV426DRAFT_702019 [Tirmania nivea]|nr:hypothetical protein EV426DRAFT_702019 [Tirmania nivea]